MKMRNNEYRPKGHTLYVDRKESIDKLIETAKIFNDEKRQDIHKLEDIEDEAVREVLSMKRFKTGSNLLDIDKIKKAVQKQASVAEAMASHKNIQKALNSCKKDIANNLMYEIFLDTEVVLSKQTIQSILTSLGKDFEKDSHGRVIVDNPIVKVLENKKDFTDERFKELCKLCTDGCNNVKINERLAGNAAANMNRYVGNKNGFYCISEPEKKDWNKICYKNPYGTSGKRGDILMYDNSDYAFGELFSDINSDYRKGTGEKIIMPSQDFLHSYKGITSDKAKTIEEAKELMKKALETNETYLNASYTEKAQYDWVAFNDLVVGETNLDVLYNLFFMLANRMGVASKMPKDKYSLFCK